MVRNLPRPLSIVLFIIQAVFTARQGWIGVSLILFKVLWQALTVWQTVDYVLPGRLMPLSDFISGLGGTIVFVGAGLYFLYRAVFARWPVYQPDAPPEIEIQQQQREQEALDEYIAEMRQRLEGSDAPLDQLPHDHPHRKSAQEDTTRILSRLSPDGKRDVVSFLHGRGLIKVGTAIISLVRANLSRANLSDLGLTDTAMSYAHLKGADLSDADLGLLQATEADIKRARIRRNARVRDVNVSKMELSQAKDVSQLNGSDLSGAVLKRTQLVGCKLRSADFAGSDLDEADLRAADLRHADNLTQEQIESVHALHHAPECRTRYAEFFL